MPRQHRERVDQGALKRALRERTQQLRDANAESQRRRKAMRDIEQKVTDLERELAKARKEAERVADEARARTALEERLKVTMKELAERGGGAKSMAHPPGSKARFLFIAGCPRSGTTEITTLLNQDPRILVGSERYKFVLDNVEPFFFAPEVFSTPIPGETSTVRRRKAHIFPSHIEDYLTLAEERWEQLAYLGDKNPHYYRQLDRLVKMFPGCRIVFMARELEAVASSYNVKASGTTGSWPEGNDYRRAVDDWNEAHLQLRRFARKAGPDQLLVVRYEDFFSGRAEQLERLYAFLELDPPPEGEVRERFASYGEEWEERQAKPLELDDAMRRFLANRKDPDADKWLADYMSSEPKARRGLLRRGG